MSWNYYGFRPYVSVAERRSKAERETAKLAKKGKAIRPVRIEGRTIAHTFWGKAWCDNLESYMDYENRLPRGRTYVRNGSVVHLDIRSGEIEEESLQTGPRSRTIVDHTAYISSHHPHDSHS